VGETVYQRTWVSKIVISGATPLRSKRDCLTHKKHASIHAIGNLVVLGKTEDLFKVRDSLLE